MKKYLIILVVLIAISGGAYYYHIQVDFSDIIYDDNKQLDAVLSTLHHRLPSQYAVVKPMSSLDDFDDFESEKKLIIKRFSGINSEIDELVEAFFDKNQKPAKLTLKSNLKHQYIVDYDDKFSDYFIKPDGGRWRQLYKDNPNAHGWITLSLPVMSKSGYIFLYMGESDNELGGEGNYYLFKLVDGELVKIHKYQTWIS